MLHLAVEPAAVAIRAGDAVTLMLVIEAASDAGGPYWISVVGVPRAWLEYDAELMPIPSAIARRPVTVRPPAQVSGGRYPLRVQIAEMAQPAHRVTALVELVVQSSTAAEVALVASLSEKPAAAPPPRPATTPVKRRGAALSPWPLAALSVALFVASMIVAVIGLPVVSGVVLHTGPPATATGKPTAPSAGLGANSVPGPVPAPSGAGATPVGSRIPAADLIINPLAIDFSGAQNAASRAQSIHLVNVGQRAITVTGAMLAGPDRHAFVLWGTCARAIIPPNAGCTLHLRFVAGDRRRHHADIAVSDSVIGSPQVLPVSGQR